MYTVAASVLYRRHNGSVSVPMDSTTRLRLATHPQHPPHPLPPTHPLYTEFVILVYRVQKKMSQNPAVFKALAIRLPYLCCESGVHAVRLQGITTVV